MKGNATRAFTVVFLLGILAGTIILVVRGSNETTPGDASRPSDHSGDPKPRQPSIRTDPHDHTVIVPSMKSPLPSRKNSLWCATFQMAWDRLGDQVLKEPIVVRGAETLSKAMNEGRLPADLLPEGSYYVEAGEGPDILKKILKDMGRLFPEFTPDLQDQQVEFAAYAYLRAGVKFTTPYFDARKPLRFVDSAGNESHVNAFGIRPEDEYAFYNLRRQVELVYVKRGKNQRTVAEMVVDPCRTSTPNRILLARIPRKETFEEMWKHLRSRLLPEGPGLGPNDTFLAPNIRCHIDQEFEELTGKEFTTPGGRTLSLDIARQSIQFTLNRGGAELGSEAQIKMLPVPTHYHFDGPFLVAMMKRGASHPFFLLWVDHAEILK